MTWIWIAVTETLFVTAAGLYLKWASVPVTAGYKIGRQFQRLMERRDRERLVLALAGAIRCLDRHGITPVPSASGSTCFRSKDGAVLELHDWDGPDAA